ncbi:MULTISPECIES: LTA synthase family protein [Clostridium]|uniref:LTA synthase family protein n=1 Tax=Clostridium cibarium TaxID=2762247 RepID=A0ABR8PWR6_9CLOT|nr:MULTISPECIES: LTA synthase family protein [Clostridium]MBD7912601.1 LTA synthase family protein [Clostridium cibarium]
MFNLLYKIRNYFISTTKHTYIKLGLFLIPIVGIIFKGIVLQSFIQNHNPYDFDFMLGLSKSQYFFSYYLAFALLFLSFSLLFKGKGRIIFIFIIDIFITLLTLLDVMYFRGFLTVPSVLILSQTANLDHLGGTVLSMLSKYDFILFLDLIILGVYVYFTRKSYKEAPKRAVKSFCFTFIVPLLFIGYIPFNLDVLHNKDVSNAYLFDDYDPTNTSKYFSSIGYHLKDLYTVYKDSRPYTLTDEEKASINDYYSWKKESLPDNEYAGISKGKNLLVIQVESLESFLIGKEINGKKITPNLDNIISKGFYFPHIYEQVNEGTSSDCDLMINTSMLPLRRGGTFFRYPNANFNSLPKILEAQGYDPISIHPDKGSFWNYANALKGGIGFKTFVDSFSFDISDQIGMGISDKSYFEQVVPKLKALNSPFYAHTITLTSHGPFDLPAELRQLSLDNELNASELGGYFESVHYTDAQIGNFLSTLDKEGLLDNTTVIITGDHTGVHKYYDHSINSLTNKEDWYVNNGEPTVPFIIYDKNIKQSKTFDTIGGQIDIMPTALYMLGIDSSKYENTALGRNLLNTNRNYAIITNGTVKGIDLTAEDEKQLKNSLELSDKMIRSDYFNNNK